MLNYGELSKSQRLLLDRCWTALSTAVERAVTIDTAVIARGKETQTAKNLQARGLVTLHGAEWSLSRRVGLTPNGIAMMQRVHIFRGTDRYRCRHRSKPGV